jgi:hypothetical protein
VTSNLALAQKSLHHGRDEDSDQAKAMQLCNPTRLCSRSIAELTPLPAIFCPQILFFQYFTGISGMPIPVTLPKS